MTSFLIRRLLIATLTLFLITVIVYALVRAMPGDPALAQQAAEDPNKKLRQEDLQRLRVAMGIDGPWTVGYARWIRHVAVGDLGKSFSRKQPVSRMIGERIGPTLQLSLTGLFLAYLLSIPIGLYACVRSGSTDERVTSTVLYMLYSVPTFVAALFLQLTFAVWLGWLPLFGRESTDFATMNWLEQVLDRMRHMILPVACYTYGSLAYYSRFIRANTLEVYRQDYIRTARAKGVGPVRLLLHHAFRNTLIPFVTLIGFTLPALLSGAVILESIFTWPGMGRLFLESIRERDYPTIMGLTLMFSTLTLLGTLLADILYSVVDPRVTLE